MMLCRPVPFEEKKMSYEYHYMLNVLMGTETLNISMLIRKSSVKVKSMHINSKPCILITVLSKLIEKWGSC